MTRSRLRSEFNSAGYYTDVINRSGVITEVIWKNYVVEHSWLPPGSRGQLVYYLIESIPVALVHQYVTPDGTLGASGLPDPKVVITRDLQQGFRLKPD